MSAPTNEQTQTGEPSLRIPEFDFADRVAKVRKTMGLKQKDFAQALGVPPGTVAGWEAGVQPRNLIGVAHKISAVSGVPVGWILGVFTDPGVVTQNPCFVCDLSWQAIDLTDSQQSDLREHTVRPAEEPAEFCAPDQPDFREPVAPSVRPQRQPARHNTAPKDNRSPRGPRQLNVA